MREQEDRKWNPFGLGDNWLKTTAYGNNNQWPGNKGRRALALRDVVQACAESGLLSAFQAKNIIEQKRKNHPHDPVEFLASMNLSSPDRNQQLSQDEILDALAAHIKTPRIQIDPLRLNPDAIVNALPKAFAHKHAILLLDPEANPAPVATADPFDVSALDMVQQRLEKPIVVYLAGKTEIQRLVLEIYGFKNSVAAAEREISQMADLQNLEQFFRMRAEGEIDSNDGHIVRAADHLLRYALDQRASDIHIEPKRGKSLVRLRIDGVLHTVHTFSNSVHSPIVSRLKTLSRMDITEKRLPQDGRIKTTYQNTPVELRVSTLPTAFGEKLVMRVFDPSLLKKDLPELGLQGDDLLTMEGFLARPHGLLLVTGPTGSGKTTTLYAAMKRLATEERNVSTVEDPIENIVEEFNQVGVQPQIGLTFASALRTLLRQDPDIIMVGEIRDAETAKMAVQAALTGHLVLSTLHTNDAPSAVERLLDMGTPPYLLASTLIGVIAQRLVRTPCPHCVKKQNIDAGEAKSLNLPESTEISMGQGCPKCRRTGYLGRTSIFELMQPSNKIANAVHEALPAPHIRSIARSEGMRSLSEAGVEKILAGETTPREVLSVAPPDAGHASCNFEIMEARKTGLFKDAGAA